jgi:hypothetical protein
VILNQKDSGVLSLSGSIIIDRHWLIQLKGRNISCVGNRDVSICPRQKSEKTNDVTDATDVDVKLANSFITQDEFFIDVARLKCRWALKNDCGQVDGFIGMKDPINPIACDQIGASPTGTVESNKKWDALDEFGDMPRCYQITNSTTHQQKPSANAFNSPGFCRMLEPNKDNRGLKLVTDVHAATPLLQQAGNQHAILIAHAPDCASNVSMRRIF